MEFGACPRCKQDIDASRRQQNPIICNHCGFVHPDESDVIQNQIESRSIIYFGLLSALAIAAYIQAMTWDQHALSIIPIKVREVLGSTSPSDWEQKAQICMDLKRYDCVEQQYSNSAKVDGKLYARLGLFQMQREKYEDAAKSFNIFFNNGLDDLDAAYAYAQALIKIGQADQAAKYFELVLNARPDVVQITVIEKYVRMLIEQNRLSEAKKWIEDVRIKRAEDESFMETELRQILGVTTASR